MSDYKNIKSPNTYWATWRTLDFLPHVFGLIDQYYKKLDKHGMLKLWEECYAAKHGTNIIEGHMSSKISFAGPNGEVVIVFANLYRNLLKHVLNTVTAQTPDTQPIASNSEYDTKKQIEACKNVQEHYRAALNMPEKYRKCVDFQLDYGMSYIVQFWDEEAQELRCESATPRRVITPLESNHPNDPWSIWVERLSRWEAIAKYNVKEKDYDNITNLNIVHQGSVVGWYFDSDQESYDNDYVDIYHFWHRRCKALPQGRYSIFCNDHVSFSDHLKETLPFEYFPVHSFIPERITESPFGYSVGFDLLGQQKILNSTLSAMFSGQDKNKTFVAVPVGSSNPMPVEGDPNLSLIQYPTTQPNSGVHSIQIFNVPEQLFKTLKETKELAQMLAGLNSTAMGDSQAKSGSHAALLFSVTQQFQTALIDSYIDLIEDVDTARISLIKNNLPETIILRVSGDDKEVYLEDFHRDDISNIKGIVRAQGISPVLSTPAGRISVGETIMKIPPEQRRDYIHLLNTGRLEDSEDFREATEEDMVFSYERQALSDPKGLHIITVETKRYDGTPDSYQAVAEVRAMVTDDHPKHTRSHKNLLNSPQVRNNAELVKVVTAHIEEHVWLRRWGSRDLLMISGQEPIPPEPGEGNPEPPPKGIPQNAAPNVAEQAQTGQTPNPRDLPRQPNQPINPMNPTVSGQALQPPGPAAM